MSIGKHARSMAAALMIGATILGLTAGPAGAESKQPKDDGVRCSMEGNLHDPPQEEDQVLYTPGEWAAAQAGPGRYAVYECQKDGTWTQVMRTQPRVPVRVPDATFTQAP